MRYVALEHVDNNVIIQGDSCITNMKELYEALVDHDTTEIELRKSFIDKYFTYTSLCEFVENSAAIAPNVRIWADGIMHNNITSVAKDLMKYTQPEELLYSLETNPDLIMSSIHGMCESYLETRSEAVEANNKIANMLVQVEDLQTKLQEQKAEYKKLSEVYTDTEAKLHALVSRVNFRYEKAVNVDKMFQLSENKYNHILYIKEISRIRYVDTLVYYISEIIKTLYQAPVRCVAIEPFYSYGCESRYPGYVPHWELTYKDVYSGNILMAGFQPKVMKDVLQDANHVQYLIILDRGGYRVPHVQNGNVSTVYTVSDMKDAPEDVPESSIISYNQDTMFIPYVADFESLSLEERIKIYSSMEITQKLIKLLEEVQ